MYSTPEKKQKYQRKWYAKNKERVLREQHEWRINNPEEAKEYDKRNYAKRAVCARKEKKELGKKYKKLVLLHYGGFPPLCKCGFGDIRALEIDHINNDGAKHRRLISGSNWKKPGAGGATYRWLVKNNFPKGFQVLCSNCNKIKQYEHQFKNFKSSYRTNS